MSNLHAAAITDHALVLHATILTAGALPVLFRTKDALAEKAIALGAVSAVIDGLGLLDLAERPAPDVLRAGEADAHRAIVVDTIIIDFGCAHIVSSPRLVAVMRFAKR